MVSIGMPVYNGEEYIVEAIESILAQTFKDFEFIISDNASTDKTQEICEKYAKADNRIQYIRQKENIGALKNFEFVLFKSNFEYFMWAAHDDIWSENWIEVLYNKILINQKCVGVFGKLLIIDSKSKLINHVAIKNSLNYAGKYRRLKYYIEPETFGKANVWYSIFKKSYLKNTRIENITHDYELIYNLLSYGDILSDNKCYLKKRVIYDREIVSLNEPAKKFTVLSSFKYKILFFKETQIMYYSNSKSYEKLMIFLLAPIKLLFDFYLTLLSRKINKES